MKTSIQIKPSSPTPRKPISLRDSAPPLESKGRKIRAKISLSAPATLGAVEAMPDHERAVIEAALAILRARMRAQGARAGSPSAARELALLHMANLEVEHFAVMFLDAQHCLIAFEEMFKGTLTQTSIYPREVVRAALRHNAHAVILVHNHPSSNAEPSRADELLTRNLKEALALVDVATADHLIVAGDCVTSFAERGML